MHTDSSKLGLISAWGSIGNSTIRKTYPTLHFRIMLVPMFFHFWGLISPSSNLLRPSSIIIAKDRGEISPKIIVMDPRTLLNISRVSGSINLVNIWYAGALFEISSKILFWFTQFLFKIYVHVSKDSYIESGTKSEIRIIVKWTKIGFGHVIMNFEGKLSEQKFNFPSKSITWE